MSLTVEVVRGLGDIPGPEITCAYFEDEAVYGQRGRVQIDQATKGLQLANINLPGMRTHVRPGHIIRMVDIDAEHRGKVTSIQYSVGMSADGEPYAVCSLGLRLLRVA